MATSPKRIREILAQLASRANREIKSVATQGQTPSEVRAALFAATPLILGDYVDGSAALALDWYEELRGESNPRKIFRAQPFTLITNDDISAMVAKSTEALHELELQAEREIEEMATALRESLELLDSGVLQAVHNGFRDTVTENVTADPESVGWKRFARPGACKFCLMLAAKGAVYTKETARFAAHAAVVDGKRRGGDCQCIAGPEFAGDEVWDEATPLQYTASQRKRTPEQAAKLREYLNEHYPDAPG